ncbi:relaxase/mobilization nuclease domain-containing protein [Saccharothrix sp. S26]|uniref:relaxase/mobilization nuclease domain-containing protein n=1 Tax=Saccharothrix sp. S26 TaxID=2907215 RepID=UPI001F475836|nr:relaxase/mobilization nuclease domain-containing protein [Saccharothrix sp. S26]MCE6999958.1 relaxase/mobilization nuclease domain-containing protein [Saccharothrix sp. S26]
MAGLVFYLFGPGRHNEHTDQHVIASWDGLPDRHQPPRIDENEFDTAALAALAATLSAPAVAAGVPQREPDQDDSGKRPQGPVWHCSLRTAPGDRELIDDEWTDIAADVLHRTGIAPADDPGACRWIAVRHAADHIHIAAVLVRQDTLRRVEPRRDYHRVREACLDAEQRHGLTPTTPIDRTAPVAPDRAEIEKAARAGRAEPSRERLRRVVRFAAARSGSLEEFAAAVADDGLVDLRWRTDRTGRPVGYAVALRGDRARPRSGDDELVWFGGRSLAADLSLSRLAERFAAADPLPPPVEHGFAERDRVLAKAHDVVDRVRAACAAAGHADPGIAHATGDLLLVLAHSTEGAYHPGPLTTVATRFEHAARHPGRGEPERLGSLARDLRLIARDVARLGLLNPRSRLVGPAVAALVLVLISLVVEIAAWRASQRQHAAARHATATHTALTEYYDALPHKQPTAPHRRTGTSTADRLAGQRPATRPVVPTTTPRSRSL